MGNNLTPVVRNLLIINLLVFALDVFSTEDFGFLFGLRYIGSEQFQAYQFLTYMFVHSQVGIMHIFGNMFGLFMFGPWLEHTFGSRRFLTFYILTGMGAGLFHSTVTYIELNRQEQAVVSYIAQPTPDAFVKYMNAYEPALYRANIDFIDGYAENPQNERYKSESVEAVKERFNQRENIPTVGASGAIFGILLAFALLFPNVELFLFFIPLPIKAKYFVAFYVVYEIYSGFQFSPESNVAHFAHLGGALIGYILVRFWRIQRQL